MVEKNFLAGGAGINVFARQSRLGLSVVDAGVAHDFGQRTGLIDAKVSPGTRNYVEEAAMSATECEIAVGAAPIVETLAKQGCNTIGFGEMGIGNTASASLITHCLAGVPLAASSSAAAPAPTTPACSASVVAESTGACR